MNPPKENKFVEEYFVSNVLLTLCNITLSVILIEFKSVLPTRVKIVKGDIKGMVAIDQIRIIDKNRIVEEKGRI